MWGRPVIRPFDAEEVCQEAAFSGNEPGGDDDEEASTPQNQTFAEDMEEEHTPRTPSAERMGTPPPPEPKGEAENGISPRSRPSADQTEEGERGTLEGVGAVRPETPQHAGVPESPNPESTCVVRPEAPQPTEMQDRPEADPEVAGVVRLEAPQPTRVEDMPEADLEASTSGPRPTDSKAAPNTKATPAFEEPNSSRFRATFEVLGRGPLGHPMEAIKNLIPEGFLVHVGTASPERIVQGILISQYQVNFFK